MYSIYSLKEIDLFNIWELLGIYLFIHWLLKIYPTDTWIFKNFTKDIKIWTFRKPPIIVLWVNPKTHSPLNLYWMFIYKWSMYIYINPKVHEIIAIPFNHCLCGVSCLPDKFWKYKIDVRKYLLINSLLKKGWFFWYQY